MELSAKEAARKTSSHRNRLEGLFKQKNAGTLCDVQLHVGKSNIWGHACVLASCSSYFAQCFQLNFSRESTWETHWCYKKPLIIDLDPILNKTERLCVICVSTIIDFMYLRELIVMQGHFQHFCEIVRILKVFDLLPLCEKYLDKKHKLKKSKYSPPGNGENSDTCTETHEDSEIITAIPVSTSRSVAPHNTDISKAIPQNNLLEKEVSPIPAPSENIHIHNILGISNSTIELSEKNMESSWESKYNTELTSVKHENNEKTEIISIEHSYTNKVEVTSNELNRSGCECDCCIDTEVVSSSNEVQHSKKRKMFCEICKSTSTSVKLMLKHIESKNHYGKVCPICNIQTQNIDTFKQHLEDHVNSKPYLCHVCKKRNRHWEYHKMHLRTHCNNKEFKCEICLKSFKRNYNLMVHMKTHNKNYLCNKCDYLTSDLKVFKNHTLKHDTNSDRDTPSNLSDWSSQSISETDLNKHEIQKKFHCQICGESFTKKKNLLRHIELKYTNVPEYKCSICKYVTKRTDLLRNHLKKHHNCTPTAEEEEHWKKQKFKSKKLKEVVDGSNNVTGVLIPVQLISASDQSFLHSLNVEKDNVEISVNTFKENYIINKNEVGGTSKNIICNEPQLYELPIPKQTDEVMTDISTHGCINDSRVYKNVPDVLQTSNINENENNSDIDKLPSIESGGEACSVLYPEARGSFQSLEVGSDFIDRTEDIWLNEATGELLSGNNFMKVHLIENGCVNDSKTANSTITPSLEFKNSFETLILNEATNGIPVFDFVEDPEEFKSNPQTPQTNLVELDDPDNYFSWDCLDNGFCSTWVLNETTGELNMVSFGLQPLKNSDELILDENTGTLTSVDDDETALFLNEGTGDLSVIYFNPNKDECSPLQSFYEQLNQEALETRSEYSDDESEFLNDEFLRASANFMADSGNEIFLNELTGEFDIAHLNNYQQENHITGNEHGYLNEETGEISWNILAKDINGELFSETEMLAYDYDDSLHCEDLDTFPTEMDNLSSHLCLEGTSESGWQQVDENCDALLNECTGEFIKKD